MRRLLFILGLALLLCLLPWGSTNATIRTISSLPYTTQTDNDTVRISGTKVSGTGSGITVNNVNVWFDLGVTDETRDTVEFNTGATNNQFGFRITTDGGGCKISGGVILCSADSANTGNECIEIIGPPDITLDSVYAQSAGFSASCVAVTTFDGSISDIKINSGRYLGYSNGNPSRCEYTSSGIRVLGPTHEGGNKTLVVDGAFVFSNQCAIRLEGNGYDRPFFEIKNCTLGIDARNDYYDGTNTNDICEGSANSSAIGLDGVYEGSSIHDNLMQAYTPVDTNGNPITLTYDGVISWDTLFYGSDDLLAMTEVFGTEADPFTIYNNEAHVRRGRDAYYNESRGATLVAKFDKGRQIFSNINKWVLVYNNDVTIYVKGDSDYVHVGHSGAGSGWQWWEDDGAADEDSAIQHYNNTFTLVNLGEGPNPEDTLHMVAGWAGISDIGPDTWYAKGNRWYNNRINTCKWAYSFGMTSADFGDGGSTGFRSENDTVTFRSDTVDNPAAVAWGYTSDGGTGGNNTYGNTGNWLTDFTCISPADYTRQVYVTGDDSSNYKIRQTIRIVVDSGGVYENAVVRINNGYEVTVDSGQTDATGFWSAIITNEWRTTGGGGDSLAFDPIIAWVKIGTDSLADTLTVDGTTVGDTVSLQFGEAEPPPAHKHYRGPKRPPMIIGATDETEHEMDLAIAGLDMLWHRSRWSSPTH